MRKNKLWGRYCYLIVDFFKTVTLLVKETATLLSTLAEATTQAAQLEAALHDAL